MLAVSDEKAWYETPGGRVKGKIVDITVGSGNYGPYPLLSIDTGGEVVDVHAFDTVIRKELALRKPRIGDPIDITYVGKSKEGTGRNGQGYKMYKVRGGSGGGYNWDSELDDELREASRPDDPPIEASDPPVMPAAEPPPPAAADDDSCPF